MLEELMVLKHIHGVQ